jgi:Zn-dependent M28 family amino/carboxypeptidase
MFLFIGGEENGLLGTKFYTQKPLFPKEKTITFINLDMVGNGNGLAVYTSVMYKNLLTYFEQANPKYIHRPFNGSAPERVEFYGRPRSDSYSFSSIGYSTMSIGTTGWTKKVYYHIPGDDPDAITIDIMQDVSRMIYVALTNMAIDETLKY